MTPPTGEGPGSVSHVSLGDYGEAKAKLEFSYFSCSRLSPDLVDLGLGRSPDPSPKPNPNPDHTLNPKP